MLSDKGMRVFKPPQLFDMWSTNRPTQQCPTSEHLGADGGQLAIGRPKWVTARCVSRKINRSLESRAVISRGTGLSVAPVVSNPLGLHRASNFGFPVQNLAVDDLRRTRAVAGR
jgi:hypothetical protein